MSVSDDYIEYVVDQLAGFGKVTSRRMFGGVGLYLKGVFFGLIADNVLYFKVDDSNRPDYETLGMEPFKPFGEESYAMKYFEVPIDVLENPEELREWANKAYAAGSKKKAAGSKKKKAKRR